jgi:hypothetical protein
VLREVLGVRPLSAQFFELVVPGYEELFVVVEPETEAQWVKLWLRSFNYEFSARPCGPVPLVKAFTPAEARKSLVSQGA